MKFNSFLENRSFVKIKYSPFEPNNDHDHCEFCFKKFNVSENEICFLNVHNNQGHWICDKCFEEFQEEYNLKLMSSIDFYKEFNNS